MKKLRTTELKEYETVEIDGEFENKLVSSKKYPLFITNAALRRGRELGLFEGSLMGELANMKELITLKNLKGDELTDEAMEAMASIDEERIAVVVYLAFIGANKSVQLSFDEFMEQYHLDLMDSLTLYIGLITDTVSQNNNFAKEFEKATAKDKKK